MRGATAAHGSRRDQYHQKDPHGPNCRASSASIRSKGWDSAPSVPTSSSGSRDRTSPARRPRTSVPRFSIPRSRADRPRRLWFDDNRAVDSEIRYARSGGLAIAYKVVGDGDVDLVYVPDFMSNLVFDWEYPRLREFYER